MTVADADSDAVAVVDAVLVDVAVIEAVFVDVAVDVDVAVGVGVTGMQRSAQSRQIAVGVLTELLLLEPVQPSSIWNVPGGQPRAQTVSLTVALG